MYLTPRRLRNMSLGVNLSGKSNAEIAEKIREATTAVDAFCNVPTVPTPHSFKGGSVVDERHGWGRVNRNHRIYPFHQPIREVTNFRILATENQYIDFPSAADYYINPTSGYIEIINFALSQVGIWGQANIPSFGLIDPVALISYSYGRLIPVVDEPVYAIDTTSGDEESGTDYMAPDGFWAEDEDVTVKVDGSPVGTGFTIDRAGGFVAFDTSPGGEVTLSYAYSIPREVQRATGLGTVAFLGEAALAASGMTGIESLKAEELELRRIGSRSGAEKGVSLPAAAQGLLSGYTFWTVR